MMTMILTMMTMTAIYLQYLLCLFLASNSGKLFVSPLIDPHTATLMMMTMVMVMMVMMYRCQKGVLGIIIGMALMSERCYCSSIDVREVLLLFNMMSKCCYRNGINVREVLLIQH